ncbi:MFS transporter [Asticcacaulis sp. AND118]|uniref:MFS transporter n=1 Tax=Asticcacaulis sp. AND118 TaxID=2840468 RepID=UPI001D000C10|nr:MFS transporter [Asticcacaulis sp. AND118]UDF05731.1 MFS transporter [Asticcacaulis sp. AND118]
METGARRERWGVVGLIFLASCLTYMDRQMFGLLKPMMQAELGWSEIDYSGVVIAFHAAFFLGFLTFGPIMDRFGARRGYAAAFTVWAAAHTMLGLASSLAQFGLIRFVLGVGESGTFPARLKAISEWFKPQERALAIGLFNAGASSGALLTLAAVPILTQTYGWRGAFLITGALSFLWLGLWLAVYRQPPMADTVPSAPSPRLTWAVFASLMKERRAWAYIVVKFLTVPVWWLYLFWLPDFLHRTHSLDLSVLGLPLLMIFALADIGSIIGGWASSRLIARGLSVGRARKGVMAACALLILPLVAVPFSPWLWVSVAIVALAAAAHQAFSANLLALPSDLFPKDVVGSVVGIGGAAGAIGAMLTAMLSGVVLEFTGSYVPIFLVAGTVYLAAVLVLHFSRAYPSRPA